MSQTTELPHGFSPITWRKAVIVGLLGVACFHLVYIPAKSGLLTLLILGCSYANGYWMPIKRPGMIDRFHSLTSPLLKALSLEHAEMDSERLCRFGVVGTEVIGAGDDLAQTERVYRSAFHNIVRNDRRSRNRDATSSNQNNRRK